MPAQIGYYNTLKSTAGKILTFLSTITLTGTDGKTITCTQDTSLDEAVAMSSKAPKESPTFTTLIQSPKYCTSTSVACNNSTTTEIGNSGFGGLFVIRDNTNGGSCIVHLEPYQNPAILNQISGGATVYTLSAPGATEVQFSVVDGTKLHAKGGSSRANFNIGIINITAGAG